MAPEPSDRQRDEYGRATYRPNEVPPSTERFAFWRGRLTVGGPPSMGTCHTPLEHNHARLCDHGWIPSGDWWLHCGRCRPPAPEDPS